MKTLRCSAPSGVCRRAFDLPSPRAQAEVSSRRAQPSRWLNMVEIELSVLARQCLKERIPNLEALKHQIEAWQHQHNQQHATVQLQFTTQDARVKLQRLYPSFDPV